MPAIPGTGPVFEFEWLVLSRRWQPYALRSLFAASLLAALAIAWVWADIPSGATFVQAQAWLASSASMAIVGTQLALVLMAGPAATAGSICVDRARGTLDHVLVTELSDSEIVLGKLAARLMPVLGLIGCTMPVVAIGTLLGGVDPAAMAGAFAVTAALAVLSCSLALTISVWATKTHEVLLATYLILIAWMLARPSTQLFRMTAAPVGFDRWLDAIDPIRLPLGSHGPSSRAPGLAEVAGFCAGCLAASAVLVSVAVHRVRVVARRERVRAPRRGRASLLSRWLARFPGPSLDGNPVLWREWHRNRPSGWARRLWTAYFLVSAFFAAASIAFDIWSPTVISHSAAWVNGFQVAVGLLLLSVGASTSLADERARGSMDVLMTTPLSTSSIVWGKWLGGFRTVAAIVALPALLACVLAWHSGSWFAVALLVAEIIAYGAFLTSLGLAMATWVSRLGRAVAICVASYVMLAVGAFFLVLFVFDDEPLIVVSPFGGPLEMTYEAELGESRPQRESSTSREPTALDYVAAFYAEIITVGCYALASAVLLTATFRTFDRSLGRVAARPRVRRSARSGNGPAWAPAFRPAGVADTMHDVARNGGPTKDG